MDMRNEERHGDAVIVLTSTRGAVSGERRAAEKRRLTKPGRRGFVNLSFDSPPARVMAASGECSPANRAAILGAGLSTAARPSTRIGSPPSRVAHPPQGQRVPESNQFIKFGAAYGAAFALRTGLRLVGYGAERES